jgi:hypothetical protein
MGMNMSYPFTIQIPPNHPASFMTTSLANTFAGDIDDTEDICLMYTLRCQFLPSDNNHWANERFGISKFRGSKKVVIRNPFLPSINPPLAV